MDSILEKAVTAHRTFWSAARWYKDQLFAQFLAHDCLASAGALTYTTLFAVGPMMTVAYTAFSILPGYQGLGERTETFILSDGSSVEASTLTLAATGVQAFAGVWDASTGEGVSGFELNQMDFGLLVARESLSI